MTNLSAQTSSGSPRSAESTFKILVATDIHLGYGKLSKHFYREIRSQSWIFLGEKNLTLAEDSFNTFEEILEVANSRDVDFILLGGDLFHDPTPSMYSINKWVWNFFLQNSWLSTRATRSRCLELLRTYVLGDKQIDFEFLSDQNQNFPDASTHSVNYEDHNLNVSIPVFSIHGNHDDINGHGRLSSINLLSSVGYVNYFGKWQDLSAVEITPIVLQKRDTKLALYGLSHIHDNRLARLFRDQKVKVHKPDVPDEEIFNLMVLHQNRAERGRFNYLPEDKLPGFLDLVVWGHEHDCRIEPEPNGKTNYWVTQPGSSVATSLSEGEAINKHIGILSVNNKEFKMQAVKLRTVRPFIFRTINIDEFTVAKKLNEGDSRTKIEKFLCQNVDEMMEEAKLKLTGHVKQPTVPLIRLRVLYTSEEHMVNTARFGQKFEKKVANPESLLKFKKNAKRTKNTAYNPDELALQMAYDKKEQKNRVEDVVESYFNSIDNPQDQLKLHHLSSMTEVCRLMVDKEDDDAAEKILDLHLEKSIAFMKERMCRDELIPEVIEEFRKEKSKLVLNEAEVENSRARTGRQTFRASSDHDEDDDDENRSVSVASKASAVRGRSRAARGGASTSSRGRGKKAAVDVSNASIALNTSKTRRSNNTSAMSAAPLAQSTQRTQRAAATKKSVPVNYISDSESD